MDYEIIIIENLMKMDRFGLLETLFLSVIHLFEIYGAINKHFVLQVNYLSNLE
jgi:hypothetical protein